MVLDLPFSVTPTTHVIVPPQTRVVNCARDQYRPFSFEALNDTL